ncbi:MAG: hypothetical protein ABIE03_01985 [Patescibacteria group bacterium]|nr:hypothetical protein [Patescibacteria group bacterium]
MPQEDSEVHESDAIPLWFSSAKFHTGIALVMQNLSVEIAVQGKGYVKVTPASQLHSTATYRYRIGDLTVLSNARARNPKLLERAIIGAFLQSLNFEQLGMLSYEHFKDTIRDGIIPYLLSKYKGGLLTNTIADFVTKIDTLLYIGEAGSFLELLTLGTFSKKLRLAA